MTRESTDKIRVLLLRTLYPHWGPHSGMNPFERHVREVDLEVQLVPMGRREIPPSLVWLRPGVRALSRARGTRAYDLNDLRAEWHAYRSWRNGNVDLVHYLDGEHSLQYLPRLLRFPGTPRKRPALVATFHQPPERLDELLDPGAVRLLDHATLVSPSQAAYFSRCLPSTKISHINLGIDTVYFRPEPNAREADGMRCLSVGFWLRDYELVLAVARRLRDYPDIEFHIVAPQVTPPAEMRNVRVHADVSDEALLGLYQKSDVLFMPLHSATANCALLEAIACGLPVVSTDLPSVRDYLPGTEADLVQGGSHERFTQSLLNLYHDPETRRRMSGAARRRALELSWEQIAPQYEAIYAELAAADS